MRWEQPVQYASRSDIGFRRANNQDALAVRVCPDKQTWIHRGHLFLVADGMGGHAVGELASKIAADSVPHTWLKTRDGEAAPALRKAIELANENIHERGAHNVDFERMGTTCTALALTPEGAVIGHVGDSRVYRIRGSRIDQLSCDHSLHWELLKQGRHKPEEIYLYEPRHVITRSLGPEPQVDVDLEGPFPILPGDVYVICSDGLTGHVQDAEIGAIARELPPGKACRLLVNLANLRGGSDNVTVVLARVGHLPEGASADAPLKPQVQPGHSWAWLSGFWAAAIAFVAGVSLMLFEMLAAGAALAGAAAAGGTALALAWHRTRREAILVSSGGEDTVLWRPYRTAAAKLTRKLVNHLAAIHSDLHHTASEEGWQIDEERHGETFGRARSSLDAGDHAAAFAELAEAIDILMAGVHEHRRLLSHQQKWGTSAAGATEPAR